VKPRKLRSWAKEFESGLWVVAWDEGEKEANKVEEKRELLKQIF